MGKVNFGVIGLKGIGQAHLRAISDVENAELVAVADINEEVGISVAEKYNVEWYRNYEDMLERGDVDAVTICTPHFLHAPMALKAIEYEKHVLVEKPMALSVVEADQMIEEAKKRGLKLGVVFQFRFNPLYLEMKRLIAEGRIGSIIRACMEICIYRDQKYYNRDAWRGKWATEGGGVLINQGIHFIDIFQWLVGKPKKLQGWISTTLHNIEVEDIASAALIFENGAHGIIQLSTVDIYKAIRYEIYGDRGKILNEDESLKVGLLERSVKEYIAEGVKPEVELKEVKVEGAGSFNHQSVINDFAEAILTDRDPRVPGEEGRASLEMVNAIILSSFEEKPVSFPISRDKYKSLMDKLAGR